MAMSMASVSNCPTRVHCLFSNPISLLHPSPVILSFPLSRTTSVPHLRLGALRTGPEGTKFGSQDAVGPELQSKPVSPAGDFSESSEDEDEDEVDWEDQILEDTVPLVGYVRMIIHSGKYESGERLSPEHEKTVCERLLPYHPEAEKKIGPGVDYITVGYHPDFERSRCLFIVRKDGQLVDFSYWKCIRGLIKKNYPLYADRFIQRHFQPRRMNM